MTTPNPMGPANNPFGPSPQEPFPPKTNWGRDSPGGPPARDRRRSRAQGDNLVGTGSVQAKPTGAQGTPAATTAQVCTFDGLPDDESMTLFAFIKAYDFAENAVSGLHAGALDPFAGVATTGDQTPDRVDQSLIVLAALQWGHDGVTRKVVMNLGPGQIVKAGIAGTYVRAHAKLSMRYLQRFQGTTIGATTQFFYIDPDPNKANNIWNSIDSPAMVPILGFDRDTMPNTPIHVDGVVSIGDATVSQGGSFDRSSRPVRKFFGTFPVAGAAYPAGGAFVFCPVAFGAGAVMLQAPPTQFIDPAGRGASPLLMAMFDHSGNTIGQQPANQFIPIPEACQQIAVYNTAVNGYESPFTLIYDLGL